jgi:hypothetical protein
MRAAAKHAQSSCASGLSLTHPARN